MLKVFKLLRHTKGRLAGKPLNPDPWQVAYILAPVFGWVRFDEDVQAYVRIIRTAYVDLPRKNGKSTLAGGIGVYLTCADGEAGAQVIAAATRKEQAGFVFDPIKLICEKSPALRPYVKTLASKIVHPKTGSYFQAVASAGDAQHGADLHGGIVDELHLHKTYDLVEAIETGTGSRSQPLIVFITTADAGKRHTPYDRKRAMIEQLARGALHDPSTYGVVFAAPAEMDPFSEEAQRAANPGYGVSPTSLVSARCRDEGTELPGRSRLVPAPAPGPAHEAVREVHRPDGVGSQCVDGRRVPPRGTCLLRRARPRVGLGHHRAVLALPGRRARRV